jgi:tetratricopeptide (TPR) repeat protein
MKANNFNPAIRPGEPRPNHRPRLALWLNLVLALGIIAVSPFRAPAQDNKIASRVERAAALIGENRLDEAERELKIVLRAAPNQAQALALLGTIRGQQKRLDEAEALFHRALQIDGGSVPVHMNLALLYMLKGLPDKTVSELREALRLDPANKESADKLARVLLSQGRLEDCIDFVERARHSPQISTPLLLVVLGDAYLKKGNVEKAEETYFLALNQQSDLQDALLGLAEVSGLKGDARAASLYLARSNEVAGSSPDLLYKFAIVALKLQAYEDARSALERAIRVSPDQAAYWIALGTVWLKKPDLSEAESAFRRGVELQPGSVQGQMSLGYALLKQKKYPEAREALEKSIKGDPVVPEPFYYLGLLAQEQNEDERAIKLLEKASQLDPSYGYVHVALGTAYVKLKNYPRAQQELELAVKLNPNESKAHYQLALLYARLKEPQKAQEEMRILEQLKDAGKGDGKETEVPAPSTRSPG